ncbi:hypothetical protein K1719_033969 [Acacia pycnantha]|nr:hypothetical protein K1719_033969 [Acacia pycnantha]
MDLETLVDFLDNPENPLRPPWERAYDVSGELVYYRNRTTRSTVFDLRPAIDLGSGIILDNQKWSLMGNRQGSFENIVVQPLSFTMRFHNLRNFARFHLFRASCGIVPMYLIVARPLFECPFCNCFIPVM